MSSLSIYKKIQIILLVLIVIALIVFVMLFFKLNKTKNISVAEAATTEIAPEDEIIEDPEDTSWDEENVEDTEVNLEDEEQAKKNEELPYYIKINYKANCITVYKKDDAGNYTVPVKAIICSTGTATPRSGVYRTTQKYRWHQLNGGVYGQYCTRITGHILFHSVPYAKQSPSSLKYTAYDKLGTAASSGCIRVTVEDAIWLYNNCPSGTCVEFYASSDPGPLGKPSAQKISSNIACRNWDPTDPLPENPWHTYVAKPESTTSGESHSSSGETSTPNVETPPQNNNSSNNNEQNNNNNNNNNNNDNYNNSNNDNSNNDGDKDEDKEDGENTNTDEPTDDNTQSPDKDPEQDENTDATNAKDNIV